MKIVTLFSPPACLRVICAAMVLCGLFARPAHATAGWLSTNGNQIRNAQGQPWHGFGANLHDVQGCSACTVANYPGNHYNADEVNRRMDALVDDWGATFIRLVLEDDRSAYSRTTSNITDDPSYMAAIEAIVAHAATKPNLYIMLSVWINPTVPSATASGGNMDHGWWPTAAEQPALQALVDALHTYPNVIFGITNEPELNSNGAEDAQVWNLMNTSVQTIRDREAMHQSAQHLIAVQGTRNWAGNIDYYAQHPISAYQGQNIIYEIHVYQPATSFNAMFVQNAKTIPVIIGEFGPNGQGMGLADAIQLQATARTHEIPYLAWTFHFNCPPNLLQDTRRSAGSDNCGVNMPLVANNTSTDAKYPNTGWGTIVYNDLKAGWPNAALPPVVTKPAPAPTVGTGSGTVTVTQGTPVSVAPTPATHAASRAQQVVVIAD